MNKAMRKLIMALGVITPIITVALAVFWSVLTATARDATLPGYLVNGAAVTVFYVLLGVSGSVFLMFLLLLHRAKTPRLQDGTPTVFFLSGAAGLLLVAYAVVLIIVRVAGESTAKGLFAVTAALALAAAAGFFFRMLPEGMVSEQKRFVFTGALGLASVVFAIVYAMACYFDMSLMMNSPFKWMDQLFFVVMAFFFLAETGLRLGKAAFGTYLALGAAAFAYGVVNAAGGITVFISSGGAETLRDSVLHDFVQLVLALYAGVRLWAGIAAANPGRSAVLAGVKDEAREAAEIEAMRRAEKSAELVARHAREEEEAKEEGGVHQQTIDDIAQEEANGQKDEEAHS